MKATYIDHMGTDLTVVNAARVSFGKTSEWANPIDMTWGGKPELCARDKNLIAFLARGCTSGDWEKLLKDAATLWNDPDLDELLKHVKSMPSHWTPFGHCQISLHLKVPIFVANQIKRHQVGFVVNEVSRRYVDAEPEFYWPEMWRKRASDKKQGSGDEFTTVTEEDEECVERALQGYKDLLAIGVCPEQARMVLPQSMFTEFWMTGSLYAWANLYVQRSDPHAQKETQDVAHQIGEIIEPLFPVSWEALTQ